MGVGSSRQVNKLVKSDEVTRAEQARRESEERFGTVVVLGAICYWEQDQEHRFTVIVGGGLERDFRSAFVGGSLWEHGAVPAVDGGRWDKHKAALAARRPYRDFVVESPGLSGEILYLSLSGEPVFDAGKRFRGYRGIARDVTVAWRAEQLLRVEHAVTRCLADAESQSGGIRSVIREVCEAQNWECGRYYQFDEKHGALRFNESWCVPDPEIQTFVAASRELIFTPGVGLAGCVWQTGQPIWVADITKDGRALRAPFALDAGMRGAFVFPVKAEGSLLGVLVFNSRNVREPDERLLQAVRVIGSQIGQFLRREQAVAERLQRDEELLRFRAALNASPDLISLVDRETMRYVDVNETMCESRGYSRAEMLALGPQDVAPVGRETLERIYDAIIASGRSDRRESSFRRKDGRRVDVEAYRRALQVGGRWTIVAVLRDITERKREEALLRLEHNVARCLTQAETAAQGMKAVLREVCEAEGWDCGRYFRVREDAGVLDFSEGWCIPDADLQQFLADSRRLYFSPGVGLAGEVWKTGRPLWVPDAKSDPRVQLNPRSDRAGHVAFVFPVSAEGKTIGVLGFTSREVRPPDERLLQTAAVISSQVGQFLQRKYAEEVLRSSEERFRSLTSLSSDAYWEQDDQYRFVAMVGTGPGWVADRRVQLTGKKRWELKCLNMSDADWAAHIRILEAREPFRDLELCRQDAKGREVWVRVSGEPVFDAAGAFQGYRGVGKDITLRKKTEARIDYLAHHDGLTTLPNRSTFSDVLGLTVQHARRYQRRFAVLLLNLDRFKIINEALGHEAGDKLLQEVSGRLTRCLRASDVVARLSGDEFVVLLQEVSEPNQVIRVVRKLLAAVMRPIDLEGRECRVTASLGVSMYPDDAQDENTLMKNADVAMCRAKEEGKNTWQFYSERMNVHSFERMALETSLRRALEREELLLHYQPILDMKSGAISGVEALIRWKHPELGMVTPAQFLPVAAETGLIVPIGNWVLRTACAQSMAWQRQGLPPIRIGVNVGPRQFADEHFLDDVSGILRETGLRPELLELELTESVLMQNGARAAHVLVLLGDMGVRLAIDDFGMGYSSLANLKRFPIDTLKVDRSFIRDLPHDAEDKAITQAIIAMGKSLSLSVVAEGVETGEQAAFLQQQGCSEMQGFYFSKPMPAEQCTEFLCSHGGNAQD